MDAGLIAIGAGLAVGLSGLASGWAEKDIGTAAVGAATENAEMFGRGLVLMVIPETIVLFGFVIAFLMLGNIETAIESATHAAEAASP